MYASGIDDETRQACFRVRSLCNMAWHGMGTMGGAVGVPSLPWGAECTRGTALCLHQRCILALRPTLAGRPIPPTYVQGAHSPYIAPTLSRIPLSPYHASPIPLCPSAYRCSGSVCSPAPFLPCTASPRPLPVPLPPPWPCPLVMAAAGVPARGMADTYPGPITPILGPSRLWHA